MRIAKEAGLPLVLENVRGAQWFMGRAQARFGSYYLWGDVPLLLPDGHPIKGMHQRRGSAGRPLDDYRRTSSRSAKRAAYSAMIAKVPLELGYCVGAFFHPAQAVVTTADLFTTDSPIPNKIADDPQVKSFPQPITKE